MTNINKKIELTLDDAKKLPLELMYSGNNLAIQIFYWILTLCLIFYILENGGNIEVLVLLGWSVINIAIFPVIYLIRSVFIYKNNNKNSKELEVILSEDFIKCVIDDIEKVNYKWDNILKYEEKDSYILIYSIDKKLICLPKRYYTIDEIKKIHELLNKRIDKINFKEYIKRKRRKNIFSILSILLVLYILNFIIVTKYPKHYETIESAISSETSIKEIINKEEIGNISFVVYIEDNDKIGNTYVIKDEKGWKKPLKYIYMLKKHITTDKYTILNYYENKKNIIIISPTFFTETNINKIEVNDNINTNFKNVSVENNNMYTNYWYAVIDELPDKYSISIGDEVFELK